MIKRFAQYVSEHRKQVVVCAIALVLCLGGVGYAASMGAFSAPQKDQEKVEQKAPVRKKEPKKKDEAKDESDKAQDDAKVDEAPVETPADKPADNSNASANASAQNDNAPASKPSNNGNGNSNGNSSNQSASKPAHSHSWKNHTATKQVWVSKIVPVYETQTVQVGTEKVSLGAYWHCSGCGAEIQGANSNPATREHIMAHLKAGEADNGYVFEKFTEKPVYETKQVQVGTRDDGHYETQSYTDYQYCDCGATK